MCGGVSDTTYDSRMMCRCVIIKTVDYIDKMLITLLLFKCSFHVNMFLHQTPTDYQLPYGTINS